MSQGTQRRLAAIVAADVAGYSRLVGLDEDGALAALRSLRRELIDSLLATHGGRIAKTAGDSLLIEFPSVVDAVRCSISLQEGMAERYREVDEDRRIRFRVGIHLSDVVAEGSDLAAAMSASFKAGGRPPLARAPGASSRARGPHVDYLDKPPIDERCIFTPPRQYTIKPPLTRATPKLHR